MTVLHCLLLAGVSSVALALRDLASTLAIPDDGHGASATSACGNVVIPVPSGGRLPPIADKERCSLYCKLESIPMAAEPLRLSRELRYKTCAVVSSSGAMLRRTFGREIDAADAVMRFGTPPMLVKFQARAGRKETFRLLNSKVQGALLPGLGLGAFDSGFFLVSDASEGKAQPGVLPLGEIHEGLMELIRQTFPRFEYKAHHDVSSGMTGITFLLHVCDEVALYEMIPSRAAFNMPWHYWEQGGDARQNYWHNSLFFEQALWRLLANASAAAVNSGVVRLRGFRSLGQRCRPQPPAQPLPSGVPEAPAGERETLAAAPKCGGLSFTLDAQEKAFGLMTESQRCSLYCRLEHLVPLGRAARELRDRLHYDTCAVVSNTHALERWRYGKEIDRADAIMRFNMAPTGTDSRPYAGSKETFRCLSAKLQNRSVSGLQLGGLGKGFFLLTDGWPTDRTPAGDLRMAKSKFIAAQPGIVPLGEARQGLEELLLRTFPQYANNARREEVTIGMVGITFLLHLCEEVALYEMVPSVAPSKSLLFSSWWRGADDSELLSQTSYQPFESAVWRLLAGANDTSQTGVLRLDGFRRHRQQCL